MLTYPLSPKNTPAKLVLGSNSKMRFEVVHGQIRIFNFNYA